MLFQGLSSSAALTVTRFTDVDRFCSTEVVGGARIIPLRLKAFSAARASLILPSCQLVLLQSFPRIMDAGLETSGAFAVVPMADNTEAVVNGVAIDSRSLMFLRGKDPGRIVEPHGNLYAIINFNSPMFGRGWPEAENRFHLFRAGSAAMADLSRTIFGLLRSASAVPAHLKIYGVARAMEESLISALDAAFAGVAPLSPAGKLSLHRYAQIVSKFDEVLTLSPAAVHYSEELAQCCGVSVRTLQTAIMTIRGMSIHHYLRHRRLWAVRQRLIVGGPGLTVKACALANGFWHLGEFAAAYRAAFAETAAETLARTHH
jgi:AraC-like DNA-binding protein